MWSRVLKVLSFLRVVDAHDGVVSLVNCALILLLVKLAMLPTIALPDLAAFFLALLAYAHKRWTNSQKPKTKDTASTTDVALLARIKDLEAFVGSVKLGAAPGLLRTRP